MPPADTMLKYGKILQVIYFNPTPSPGAIDVGEVWGTDSNEVLIVF